MYGDTTEGLTGIAPMKVIRIPAKKDATPGWPGFLGWVAATHPKLYNMMIASDPDTLMMLDQQRHSASVLSGLGLLDPDATAPGSTVASPTTGGSAMEQFVAMVSRAGAAILPLVQQQKILNIQLKRAQAGQAPLDVGAYIDPNAGMNVGMTPGTQKTLLYLGGGLAAAWIITRVIKHR
jgi:hypothetical protein